MAKKVGLEVDTSKLKKAANDVKSLKEEFNGLKDTLTKIKDAYSVAKSAADLLSEKTDVYKQKIKAGEDALKSYSQALEKLNALKDRDNSGKTAHLLSTTQTAYNKTQKEVNDYTTKLKKAEKEQDNLNKELKETPPNLKQVGQGAESTGSSLVSAFSGAGAAITATASVVKTLISTIGNLASKIKDLVEPQAEYIEDLNFLDNAYGEANNSGKQLLDTLNQMVGYDPTTLVKQTAIFRQMGNALDLDAKVADTLSTNLTKLAVDVKSITGQDLQKVASKFQSAMAGNVRAIRAYGVDVTQAGLQQEALRLGIDTQVSSMSRAEKSILTYIAMERQLSTANGDLSRTVNSVGNQWEIFKNQIAQLGRLIGGFFIPILKAILPVLNGIIMALNTIISMVMSFFGIDAESFSQEFGSVSSGIDDLTDSFDDMSDAATKSGKAAKEAQKSLRGFDKLNNITTPTSSSSRGGGGSASGGIGAINPKLLDALKGYNLHLDEMNNWATKIRDKIMSWLGFTKIVDEATGKVTYKFEGINKLIANIGKLVEKIRGVAKGIFNSPFGEVYTALVGMGGPLNFIYVHLGKILATNDEVWERFKAAISNAFETVQPLFDFFVNTVIPDIGAAFDWFYQNVLKPFSDFVDSIFTSVWEDTLLPVFEKFTKEILPPLIEMFESFWNDVIKPGAELLGNVLKPVIDTIIGVLDVLWKNVLSPIVNFVLDVLLVALRVVIAYVQNYVIPVANGVIKVLDWIWKNVLGPIVNFLKTNLLNTLDTVTTRVKSSFEGIKMVFEGLIDFITGVFEGDWDKALGGVKRIFEGVFKPIIDTINKVKKGLGDLVSGIGNVGGSIWNGVKGLFGAANGGIWSNGIWSPVHTYATGGFPTHGELFVARETSGPELVGKIGNSTAVLNNDQILDQMSIAVARGMAAGAKQENQTNIIAKGDTKGLLDFIQFEQISNKRQFGL